MIQKIKKITCAIGVALSVGLCQMFFGANPVLAQTQNLQYKNISITNASFDSNPTSSYLDTSPSGWTSEGGEAKKGIINVDNTKSAFDYNCVSSYHLNSTENPGQAGTKDSKVLMINARQSSTTDTSNSTISGFTSDAITLSANSYYRLSVWVSTQSGARASTVLTGFENTDDLAVPTSNFYHSDIQTSKGSNEWVEYSYYIQTNNQSQTIKLKLMLGAITETNQTASFGAAFFDEVALVECSEAYFYALLQNENSSLKNYHEIAYNSYDVIDANLNFNFENGLENWEEFGEYGNSTFTAGVDYVNRIEEGSDFSENNTKALKISAEEDNEVYVGFKSLPFDIKMGNVYRISVMAKAKDVVGTININLVETDYLEQEYNLSTEPTTSTITFTTTETNQLTNDYTEYAFFVCGYELYDTQAQLELVFGEETIPASGSVVFDNVKIEKYSYKDYDQQSESDAKYKKVKLSTITGTPTFANGAFNNAHSDGLFTDYPLTPDDWTLTSSTNDASCVFGVVNTSKWDLIDSTKRPSASSPLNPTFETVEGVKIPQNPQASNNILMIYNKNAATQIVTSPTFTADKNTFYALTFNYYTYGNALSIQIKDADQNIVFNDDIASSTAWNTYTILFKTEYYSVETLSLVLELNSENTNKSAYAYFDNFQFYTPSTLNNNSFQIAVDNAEKTVDLSNLGIHQTGEFNSLTSTYQPTMFTGNLESGTQIEGSAPIAFGGIITENNDYGIEFPDTHTNNINNMLMLKTLATAEYSLTSKNKISLTSGEYYKFSVYVKTSFASQIQDGQNFGAYFKLVGIDDAKIINIANHNSFNLYSIYVTVDQDTDINVQFGIVSETNDNQMALFDTFTFETISQTAFNKLTPSENLAIINHETQTTSDEEDTESTGLGGNIWIEISTILMIMAIIVAIVGALLRKTKFKKFKVKKEAEYANRAALVRDAAVVEAEKRRNTEIQSLMKEKEQLAVELKELEEQNKERISQQRKLTGKTITRKAEKEFRAYAATRQKIVKDMGRIDDRIQEAKTPEYLGRIVKIVQMQKVKAMDETPANNQNPENA